MDTLHNVDSSPLNQPSHCNRFIQSPLKVILVAIGIILIIGSAIAAGLLYANLSALSCLIGVPIGIALIVYAVRCAKGTTTVASSEIVILPVLQHILKVLKNEPIVSAKFFIEVKNLDGSVTIKDYVLPNEKLGEFIEMHITQALQYMYLAAGTTKSLGILVRTANKTFNAHLYDIAFDSNKDNNTPWLDGKVTNSMGITDTSLEHIHTQLHHNNGVIREETQWDDATGFSGGTVVFRKS